MDLEMVLNELSLRVPASDIQIARQWMSELLDTVLATNKQRDMLVLLTQRELPGLLLAPDYPIARWWGDHEVDEVRRRLFIGLVTKGPYVDDIVEEETKNKGNLDEFRHQGELAIGLGCAFQRDALALSLKSASRWDYSHLELEYVQFDNSENLISEYVQILHASHREHVLEHFEWIRSRTEIEISTGADIWKYRAALFPGLQFCEAVSDQLLALQTGSLLLPFIKRKLFELEEVSKNWQKQGGAFDLRKIPGRKSPESEATLNKYRQQHTFRCPDGEYRVFSLHVWITQSWRLHFFPVEEERRIVVGYIGEHLSTKKYT